MKTSATRQLHHFLLLCAVLLASFGAAQQAPTEAFTGSWRGAIEIPDTPLEVMVQLTHEAETWLGTIDIPAQGASGLPLDNISIEGQTVAFTIAATPGEPTFRGQLDGDVITGTFTQGGQEFPFTLTKADEAAAASTVPNIYEDPLGRFTVPVPTQWQTTAEDDYVRLASPNDGILVYIVISEGSDLQAAVTAGWELVEPGLELEPVDVLEPPSDPGVEQTVIASYDVSDPTQIYEAVAQLHDGTIYVLLIDGQLEALQRRNAQLQIAASGFKITALETTDLTGSMPLPVADISGELDAFIRESLQAFGIPGAAVAIVQNGTVVFSEGYGVQDISGNEPVTPSTQMMIGSTGKTMTALLLAALVDDGMVQWDTPVIDVLPEFAVADPELTGQITLRNLLCACTGVPRRDLELFFNTNELSAEGIIESLGSFEFFTDFGEVFQYSNQLVATAGYAAAAADGASYGNLLEGYIESLQRRVLDPIGMPNTTLSFTEVLERGQHGTPHQLDLMTGEYEPISLDLERSLLLIAPAGAHWSNVEDMGRYLLTELSAGVAPDGERVVSEENLRVTWQPQVQISANDSYALGWIVSDYYGLEMLSHGGNTLGFTSEFSFLPDANAGIVVLSNAQGANAFNGAVASRFYELLYGQPAATEAQVEFVLAQTEQALNEAQAQIQQNVDVDSVEQYLGAWHDVALGTITLQFDGDRLMLDSGEFQSEIRPIVNRNGEFDNYIIYGPPLEGLAVKLLTDADGTQTVILGEGAVSYTFERVD